MLVNPTDSVLLVVLVCVACLLLIGAIILYLHFKEKSEDKKEKEQDIFGYF